MRDIFDSNSKRMKNGNTKIATRCAHIKHMFVLIVELFFEKSHVFFRFLKYCFDGDKVEFKQPIKSREREQINEKKTQKCSAKTLEKQ